jgi:hypothetical protein
MTVGPAVVARFVCLCSCCHTKLFLRVPKWITYILYYFVMAQNTAELCVCLCVCVFVIARHCDGLHSFLLSLYVFLVLFSDLLFNFSQTGFPTD